MAIEEVANKSWSPQQVWNTTEKMQEIERVRACDRALINAQFNGNRPYTKEEVEKHQIHINVNWGEGKQRLLPAINQLNNALIFKERFFTALSKKGKVEKRQEFGETFTDNVHEALKSGPTGYRHLFVLKSRNAAVALHGIGPIMWMNSFRWRGRAIPLEDLLIPTDTLCDFSNLMFFAVNLYLTAGEFFDMTSGDKVDDGWDKTMVDKILQDIIKPSQQQSQNWATLRDQPEKRVEWLKQNRFAWDYDAVSTVKLRMFFYKHEKSKEWCRCAILREGTPKVPANLQSNFLYDGKDKPFAKRISQILHVQYGDNSIVAPLKYHSVRGLGVDLYSPVETNNRMRCEFAQHVLFQLKTILRISNPVDRDRPKVMDLSQYSVLEDGVTMIPANERYQIDPRLVESAISMTRQLMGEASSGYVKDVQADTNQPRTATESSILANEAREQVSNMLQSMYAQEEFLYEEIVRRFCDQNSEDEEVKEFQQKCITDGVPKELMVASNWSIKVERVLGAGDQYQASQEANALLANSQRYDPNSQRIILRKWTTTTTRDPKMAQLLVPSNDQAATPGVIAAEDVFGTLMNGIKASIREGIDRGPYVEALIGMLGSKVDQVTKIDNVGSPEELLGLQAVIGHIEENIQILAQDPEQKPKVKMYGDELGNLANLVKGFGERLAEKAQQEQAAQQIDPEAQAKAQATMMQAETKIKLNQESAAQKMEQREKEFQQKMMQEIEQHQSEMKRQMEKFQADMLEQGLRAGQDLKIQEEKAEADKKAASEQPVSK